MLDGRLNAKQLSAKQLSVKCQLSAKWDRVRCATECHVELSADFYQLKDVRLVLPWHSVFLALSCLGIQSISLLPLGQWFYDFFCSYIKDNLIGPSGVRALPMAAGINVGGNYF